MSDLLDRLRREDPSALEEVGHRLLPFVQVALLGQALELKDSKQLLKAFGLAVASAAQRASDDASLGLLVLSQLREGGAAIPAAAPVGAQADALARLKSLRALPGAEQELVMARFVERLGARAIAEERGLEQPAVVAVLARGAALLVGPPAGGGDWAANPSVSDPDAAPAPELVELENLLSSLAIDVTALELQPLMSPVLAPRPPRPELPPEEHFPSQVHTQGALDLPAQASFDGHPRVSRPEVRTQAAAAAEEETSRTAVGLTAVGDSAAPAPGRTAVELTPVGDKPPGSGRMMVERIPVELTPAPKLGPGSRITLDELTPVAARPLPSSPTVAGLAPVLQLVDDEATSPLVTRPMASWAQPSARTVSRPMFQKVHRSWWWGATAACAALGFGLYLWGIGRVEGRTRAGWDLVPVIVAARDLPEGEVLTLELVATRAVPARFVTPSVVKPDLLGVALGQRLSVGLQAGDHLQWAQFDSVRSQQRLSKRIGRSQRAYSIPVTEIRAVGGWLKPDQSVDLVMNLGEGSKTEAITLLQHVKLLAVGDVTTLQIGGAHLKFTTLSLLLDPEEARDLAVALRMGDLTATLRRDGESEFVPREGRTTLQTLLLGTRAKALERRRFQTIQTIRGRP